MVDVGELKILGTLDTNDIDKGVRSVNLKLNEVRSQVDLSSASFEWLSSTVSAVGSGLLKIGTMGVAAMTGLASISPQVAPELAKMRNGIREISFALGERLQPLFSAVAEDLIPAIGTAIERMTPHIERMVEVGVTGISDISNALAGEWHKIENLVPKGIGASIGIALGAKFGLGGMLIGAALGAAAGDRLAHKAEERVEDMYQQVPSVYDGQIIPDTGSITQIPLMRDLAGLGGWSAEMVRTLYRIIVQSIDAENEKSLDYAGGLVL